MVLSSEPLIQVDQEGNLIVKNNINFEGQLLQKGNNFITNPRVIETIVTNANNPQSRY